MCGTPWCTRNSSSSQRNGDPPDPLLGMVPIQGKALWGSGSGCTLEELAAQKRKIVIFKSFLGILACFGTYSGNMGNMGSKPEFEPAGAATQRMVYPIQKMYIV